MGTFSDGLLGFALGAGTTLSAEFDRQNKEQGLIRAEDRAEGRTIAREDRAEVRTLESEGRANIESDRRGVITEGYAINAHDRQVNATNSKLEYMKRLELKQVRDLNTQNLDIIEGGESAALAQDVIMRSRKQEDEIDTSALGVEAAREKKVDALAAVFADDERRIAAGMETSRSSNVNVSLTPTEIRQTIVDVTERQLGQTEDQYRAELKKEEIETLSKTLKSRSEDSQALMTSILNGDKPEVGPYFGRDVVDMLKQENAHHLLTSLSTKTKQAVKKKGNSVAFPDVADASRAAIDKASDLTNEMINGWQELSKLSSVQEAVAASGTTTKEVLKKIKERNQERLREAMGLTEKEAEGSLPYKRMWNTFNGGLDTLLVNKMQKVGG
jgi:hypothetical protein